VTAASSFGQNPPPCGQSNVNCSEFGPTRVSSRFGRNYSDAQYIQNGALLVGSTLFIGHEGPQGEKRYNCTLFLTSALEGGEESVSRPDRTLPPGKTRYPLYRRRGEPQARSGQVRKITPPPVFDPRTVQPVGSRMVLCTHLKHSFVKVIEDTAYANITSY